jgi:hypothetical protein
MLSANHFSAPLAIFLPQFCDSASRPLPSEAPKAPARGVPGSRFDRCSQCTLDLPSLDFRRARHCKCLRGEAQLAPVLGSIGVFIIYTVSQIDTVLTDPGRHTLVVFGKFSHSVPLVSFSSKVFNILCVPSVRESPRSAECQYANSTTLSSSLVCFMAMRRRPWLAIGAVSAPVNVGCGPSP